MLVPSYYLVPSNYQNFLGVHSTVIECIWSCTTQYVSQSVTIKDYIFKYPWQIGLQAQARNNLIWNKFLKIFKSCFQVATFFVLLAKVYNGFFLCRGGNSGGFTVPHQMVQQNQSQATDLYRQRKPKCEISTVAPAEIGSYRSLSAPVESVASYAPYKPSHHCHLTSLLILHPSLVTDLHQLQLSLQSLGTTHCHDQATAHLANWLTNWPEVPTFSQPSAPAYQPEPEVPTYRATLPDPGQNAHLDYGG